MAGGDEIHCKLPKNYSQTIIQKLDVGLVQPSKNSLIHRVAYIEGNGQSFLHLNHISTPLVKTYDLDAVHPLKPSENKCMGLHTKLHSQTFEGNHCMSIITSANLHLSIITQEVRWAPSLLLTIFPSFEGNKLCYHNFLSIITQKVLNHPLQNESPLFYMRDIALVVFSSKVLLNLLNSINKMISEN